MRGQRRPRRARAHRRPAAVLTSSPTIGIDLGGTKCLGIVLGGDGSIVAEHRVPTPVGADAIVEAIASVAHELRAQVPAVAAMGVGAPGLVDAAGVLRFAPNLPGVIGLPVKAELEARLGLPVQVDNDATAATWGERCHGAGVGFDHLVLVTLGTGIGGGIVADGRLYRGAHGFAGEIGHMIVDPNGPQCPCGQRGCWERFASGSGLGKLAREAAHAGRADRVVELAGGDPEDVRGEHVSRAAAEGDAAARRVFRQFGWWVALGLANLANIFDPQAFVLGGGLVETGDLLLDPVRDAFSDLLEGSEHRPEIAIVPARLGEHAGAIGAAALARGERS